MIMTIHLQQLRFYAYHGALQQERVVGGEYVVDLHLTVDVEASAYASDCLEGTVNYAEVYDCVAAEMKVPSNLLEHVAHRIASRLLKDFPRVLKADVTICKLNPPMGAASSGAGVRLVLPQI